MVHRELASRIWTNHREEILGRGLRKAIQLDQLIAAVPSAESSNLTYWDLLFTADRTSDRS